MRKRGKRQKKTVGRILAVLALFALSTAPTWAEQTTGSGTDAFREVVTSPSGWLDFTLQDVGGRTVSLRQFIGRKPILLYFWATWCPHCKESVPDINRMHGESAGHGNVQILALDFMESPEKVSSFIAARKVAFPVLLDREGVVARMYRVVGIPTYILIDKNGRIVHRGHETPDVLKILN